MTSIAPHASGIRTERVAPNVVVTWFSGYVTKEMAEQRFVEFRELVSESMNPVWIMELSAMTGFDPRAVSAGATWWRDFKTKSDREILLISTLSAARMAGSTLSFSVGLPVKVFATLDDCFESLGIILPMRRSS